MAAGIDEDGTYLLLLDKGNLKEPNVYIMSRFEKLSGNYDVKLACIEPEKVIEQLANGGKDSLDVVEWACKALASITLYAVDAKDIDLQCRLLDIGVCEMIITILSRWCSESSIVGAYGCETIRNLAFNSQDLREFLGESGACEMVLFALSMHLGDALVTVMGTAAVVNLLKSDHKNSYRFAMYDGCEILAQAGNFGLNIRDPKCFDVAANVCFSIASLSEASNASKLLDSGACDLVCALARLHIEDSSVYFCACKALSGLSSMNSEIRECIGAAGACEIVFQGLEMHRSDVTILRESIEIIMHLSLSPNNSVKFTNLKAARCILDCLDKDLMEVEYGVEVCSGALLNLIIYGDMVKEGRDILIECDALSILQRAKSSTRASYRARENVTRITDMLNNNEESEHGEHVLVGVVLGSEYKKGNSPLKAELRIKRYTACDSEANSSDDGFFAFTHFYGGGSEDIETKSSSSHANSVVSTPSQLYENRDRNRTASNYTNSSVDDFVVGIENRNIIEM